jgi:hypothetical protein
MSRAGPYVVALAAVLAAGCARLVTTPPPVGVKEVAVLPVDDVYGDGLPVRWASISGLLGERPPEITVPGLLAEQLRAQLAAKGFAVSDPARVGAATRDAVPTSPAEAARIAREAGITVPVVFAKLSRWDADQGVSPNFITVKLEIVLVDPATAAPLWSAHWQTRPVPTAGSGSYAVAAERAAQEVIAQMVAGVGTPPTGIP